MGGSMKLAREDVERVAGELTRSADVLSVVQGRIAGRQFGAAVAGRDHHPDGAAIAAGFAGLAEVIRVWSESTASAAEAIRGAVAGIDDAEGANRSNIEAAG